MSTDSETLFHYCSNEAFVSMLRGRSIWLSSLNLSNDSMEGRLVTTTLMRIAERENLPPDTMERLKECIRLVEGLFEGLGFCLSEKRDLLSQWRGYADDAKGVAIGFSRRYLDDLSLKSRIGESGFTIHQVEYDPSQQELSLEPAYHELRSLIDKGAFRFRGRSSLLDSRTPEQIAADDEAITKTYMELMFRILALSPHLYTLKAAAFEEECEWRLVSMFLATQEDEKIQFRASGARIIPYRIFELSTLKTSPIIEVILGPRNETPESIVRSLLKETGFGSVDVRRSAATYR
jgi:hypothetical protein